MPILNIKDMKVVSPSPDNFILDLEISSDIDTEGHHYKYIASGEQIYQKYNSGDNSVQSKLLSDHVAHSSLFKLNDDTVITAYSLFDMNDMGFTTDQEDIDNLLLMPNANTSPSARVDNPIPMHVINKNAVYGYVETKPNESFGFPTYENKKFVMSTHNKLAGGDNPKPGTTDTLSLYKYQQNAINVSAVLGLGKQVDISSNYPGFDKMFVFDPTNDNYSGFNSNNTKYWQSYQTNRNIGSFQCTNNFDNGTLLVRTILFPKQTLNNEYSTEREYINNYEISAPFKQVRKYEINDGCFYSNGTHIVLNHKDSKKFDFGTSTEECGGTMVTSTYNRRFGDVVAKLHDSPTPPNGNAQNIELENGKMTNVKLDYNTYLNLTFNDSMFANGQYRKYTPELINRENETMSDTALMTSQHKANIFDIGFSDLWKGISDKFVDLNAETNGLYAAAYTEIRDNLRKSIKTNLYKLVDDIKPVHTELYKIDMGEENDIELETSNENSM